MTKLNFFNEVQLFTSRAQKKEYYELKNNHFFLIQIKKKKIFLYNNISLFCMKKL